MSNYIAGILRGVYLGIGTPVSRYELSNPTPGGYSDDLVKTIAAVRTDLDRFSPAEIAVLQNHGYFVAEAGLRKHLAPHLEMIPVPPAPPYPEWMDKDRVTKEFKNSSQTKLPFGRGPWLRYLLPKSTWPRP